MIYSEIVREIDKAHLLRKLFIKRAVEEKLHFQQIFILRYINEHQGCTQADIAKYFHVSSATITVSTQKMQKAGFIKKTISENNLRCKSLSLTEKGKDEVLKIKKLFNEYDSNVVFSGMDLNELEIFSKCLKKINKNMADAEGIKISYSDDDVIAEIIDKLCQNPDE